MEIFKKRYYTSDGLTELIEKLTSAWSWDNITTGTNAANYNYTRFYVERMTLEVLAAGDGYINSINIYVDENVEQSYVTYSGGSLIWLTYVKSSNALIMQFCFTSNTSVLPSYGDSAILAIGSGTNMITQSKENLMAIIGHASINSTDVINTNKVTIPSNDIITIESRSAGRITYNSDVALTIINPLSQEKSQVIMDDIYIVNRCNLAQPSFGECTLNGKKYFMFYHIWIPYE